MYLFLATGGLFKTVHVEMKIPLIPLADGSREFGNASVTKLTYTGEPHIDFGSSALGVVAGFLANEALSDSFQAVLDELLRGVRLLLPQFTPVVL